MSDVFIKFASPILRNRVDIRLGGGGELPGDGLPQVARKEAVRSAGRNRQMPASGRMIRGCAASFLAFRCPA